MILLSVIVNNEKQPIQQDKLMSMYHKQPVFHQAIMQLKALLFLNQNKSDFFRLLSKTDLNFNNKKLSTNTLSSILDQLVKDKLLLPNFDCAPKIRHQITQLALSNENSYLKTHLSIIKNERLMWYELTYVSTQNVTAVHIAIHANDVDFFNDKIKNFLHCGYVIWNISIAFYSYSIDLVWLKTRNPIIQALVCYVKLQPFFSEVKSLPPDLIVWVDFWQKSNLIRIIKNNFYLYSKLLSIEICFGNIFNIEQDCQKNPEFYAQEALGTIAFLKGDLSIAERYFTTAIKLFNKSYQQDKIEWFRNNLHVVFYGLICVYQNNASKLIAIMNSLRKLNNDSLVVDLLQIFAYLQQNSQKLAQNKYAELNNSTNKSKNLVTTSLFDLLKFLLDPNDISIKKYSKDNLLFNLKIQNLLGAQIYAECLLQLSPEDQDAEAFFKHNYFGKFRFLNLFKVKQPWEYAIDQLKQIVANDPQENFLNRTDNKRLIWLLDPEKRAVEVLEQKQKANGIWSNGKPIALKRFLYSDPALSYITEHDKKAISGITREEYGWYGRENYYLDPQVTINALIGHPLVLHAQNPKIHIELVKGDVELQIENTPDGYLLSLKHYSIVPGILLEKETSNRYKVINISADAVCMSQTISQSGMRVPADARARIIDIVHNTKLGIVINSDVMDDNIPAIDADPNCWVQLLPTLQGLKINLMVRPFGETGPYCMIAHGQQKIISSVLINDVEIKQKAIRNFTQERIAAELLIKNCATLTKFDAEINEWNIDDLESCLQILTELEEYRQKHPIHLEWPKGQTLKVQNTISSKNLSLSIRASHNWFEYDGSVNIENTQVLELKKLLDLLGNGYGRFIKLKDGEFLALTENFKKQLEELKATGDHHKIYHLGAGILRELADEAKQLQFDNAWEEHVRKIKSMEKHLPKIPKTLQGSLRSYQEEGFCYLSRLAHWEIGACLADDMGLGKTIQAISLLLEQAKHGPSLIVAPTSICFVWMEELTKFAPTLNIHVLNTTNDREKIITSLSKMDLLICSYALLHQTSELLSTKTWQVIILDEAQAIKNVGTKRWQSVTKLIGKCRIALTGTPIENHLGELWSIFHFLNPGLLGSLKSFQQRFAIPIEKNQDPAAKRALKNLICPYILRRMKSEVLQELPAKTEQTICIEPSNEEMAFIEAVRVKALENITKINNDQNLVNKQFSILAEISKLRQACCHSSLVDENIHLDSSKIKTFLEIVKSLIENKHRALVFSQYVRFLAKIKNILTNEGVTYQYLDGTTPAKQRQNIVEDFQSGDGDVFLISLKAGGMGLNLTSADYVIILDPWWNPAVEDQASDRAHRIGQQRPVTVYRLVIKNSIEEKIIKLHQDKRNLANDLLSGSDMSGKITAEELVQLIS